MKLAEMMQRGALRKNHPRQSATATPATPATLEAERAPTVATVATVIVAKPRGRKAEPPRLTPDERADIHEARIERAAIMEFDGGLSRDHADAQARRAVKAYRVKVDMGTDREPRWAFMLGCDGMTEAKRTANNQFGADRVLAVVEQGA